MLIASPCYAATDYTADANCMGAWAMSTSNGDETDLSGEGETLTQSGTILTSVTVPAGYDGTSRDFERGSSEFLEHADGGSTDIREQTRTYLYVPGLKWRV